MKDDKENLNESKKIAINGEDNQEKNIKNPNLKTVAILPFDNTSKDKTIEPLRKGFSDMLITDLSGISNINVVDREDLEAIFKELHFSETKFIDSKTALKVGKMLSAHYLMTGSFMYMFGKLRVDAKIIKTETGEIVWAKGVEGDLEDTQKYSEAKTLFEKILSEYPEFDYAKGYLKLIETKIK